GAAPRNQGQRSRLLTQLDYMPAQGGIVSSTSGSAERSSGRTILAVILGIIALIFIVVAIIYVAEPAKSLPSFVPGHIAGSTGHHPLRAAGGLHGPPPAAGRGLACHRYRLGGRGVVRPGVQAQAAGRGGEQQGK